MKKLGTLLLGVYLLQGLEIRCFPQTVTINWETKTLVEYPPEVSRKMGVTVVVKEINNVLYQYGVQIHATRRENTDDQILQGLLERTDQLATRLKQKALRDTCTSTASEAADLLSKTIDKIRNNAALVPKLEGNEYPSVPLSRTKAAWKELIPDIQKLDGYAEKLGKDCTSPEIPAVKTFMDNYAEFQETTRSFQERLDLKHELTQTASLLPDNDYTITVEEAFEGKTTQGGVKEFKFSPVSNLLMLSLGPVFTGIEARSYEARKFPGQEENALVVEGGAVHPVFGTLLNYQVPMPGRWASKNLSGDSFGLAASFGPLFALGSGKSETNSLGFFAGPSIHFWRRFFLTFGWHVGQFADYPVGFFPGRTVPANFGELTPVKRWTVRFALGLSVRAKDFNALPQAPQTTEGKPHTEAASPKEPEEAPPPANKSGLSKPVETLGGDPQPTPQVRLDSFAPEDLLKELKAREAASLSEKAIPRLEPRKELEPFDSASIAERLRYQQKAIYVPDNRHEVFEETNPTIQSRTESGVSLFHDSDVTVMADSSSLKTRTFQEAQNLCSSEPYLTQPVGAFCSGVLVAPDIVATAGHCVNGATVGRIRFVFGFKMIDAKTPNLTIKNSEIYPGVRVIDRRKLSTGPDWALVKLDRPVTNHPVTPLRRSGKIADGQTVYVIGHPSGLPAKIADNGKIRDNSPAAYFVTNLDTYGGNSGSPVFDSDSHMLEGLLVRGEKDFISVGPCRVSLICPDTGCRGEDITRTAEFAALLP